MTCDSVIAGRKKIDAPPILTAVEILYQNIV